MCWNGEKLLLWWNGDGCAALYRVGKWHLLKVITPTRRFLPRVQAWNLLCSHCEYPNRENAVEPWMVQCFSLHPIKVCLSLQMFLSSRALQGCTRHYCNSWLANQRAARIAYTAPNNRCSRISEQDNSIYGLRWNINRVTMPCVTCCYVIILTWSGLA